MVRTRNASRGAAAGGEGEDMPTQVVSAAPRQTTAAQRRAAPVTRRRNTAVHGSDEAGGSGGTGGAGTEVKEMMNLVQAQMTMMQEDRATWRNVLSHILPQATGFHAPIPNTIPQNQDQVRNPQNPAPANIPATPETLNVPASVAVAAQVDIQAEPVAVQAQNQDANIIQPQRPQQQQVESVINSNPQTNMPEWAQELQRKVQEMENKNAPSKKPFVATQSPFVDEIRNYRTSGRYTYNAWKMYNGLTDPESHIQYFNRVAMGTDMPDAMMCRLFPSTLEDAATD